MVWHSCGIIVVRLCGGAGVWRHSLEGECGTEVQDVDHVALDQADVTHTTTKWRSGSQAVLFHSDCKRKTEVNIFSYWTLKLIDVKAKW